MEPMTSSEHAEPDQEIIKILKDLGTLHVTYPPHLLRARRAAFLAQVEGFVEADLGEAVATEDRELAELLAYMGSVQAEYPSELRAARRAALFDSLEDGRKVTLLDQFRVVIQKLFRSPSTFSNARRFLLLAVSLLVAVCLASLFLPQAAELLNPSPYQGVVESASLPRAGVREVALNICSPGEETPSCLPGGLDLADRRNGSAQPAVSKDARENPSGVQMAAYVNDGREGASWVSNSADSWIKIDLGKVTTIDTVSLRRGNPSSSADENPGHFVIAVALTDVYADGDSQNDYIEYAQVFHSEATSFDGAVSEADTIRTQFPPVQARFVKITFQQAGTAIEQVGVFMMQLPEVAGRQTQTPQEEEILTPAATSTQPALAAVTPVSSGTPLPTGTSGSIATGTPPAATATALPTEPLPSDTPIPSPTTVLPTAIPPTIEAPVSTEPIVVTGSNQNVTFTCNGNAAEVRGYANTVTLLGSCSSITVTGNNNRVFWESGSPVITNRGRDNVVQQL